MEAWLPDGAAIRIQSDYVGRQMLTSTSSGKAAERTTCGLERPSILEQAVCGESGFSRLYIYNLADKCLPI